MRSPWPALILDRALLLIQDANAAACEALGLVAPGPWSVAAHLELEVPSHGTTEVLTLPVRRLAGSEHGGESWLLSDLALDGWLLQGPLPLGPDAAYTELQQVSQRKSELIANISHELRTPLTAILGWPEIILDAEGMPALATQAAQAIRKDGLYLRQLLEDLIDLSKIEAGHFQLDLRREELAPIVLDALDMLQERARTKQLRVETMFPSEPIWVLADPLRMTQIVLNYLSNAIKYTQRQGRVKVMLESHNEQAILSIEDDGIGMDEQVRQRIFDRFMRADEVLSTDGAGIGLALVKKLVDLHGGRAWVESQLGKGSTFYMALPQQPDQPPTELRPTRRPLRRLAMTHVLIVDERAEELSLLRQLLQPYFYRVSALDAPPEAAQLEQWVPDLILVSTSLTAAHHHEWLRELRRESMFKALPVVALSASAMKGDAERLQSLGYSGFLAKPFLKEDLLQYIQLMLTGSSPYV